MATGDQQYFDYDILDRYENDDRSLEEIADEYYNSGSNVTPTGNGYVQPDLGESTGTLYSSVTQYWKEHEQEMNNTLTQIAKGGEETQKALQEAANNIINNANSGGNDSGQQDSTSYFNENNSSLTKPADPNYANWTYYDFAKASPDELNAYLVWYNNRPALELSEVKVTAKKPEPPKSDEGETWYNDNVANHPNRVHELEQNLDENTIWGADDTFTNGAGEPSSRSEYISDIFSIPQWSIKDFMNERVSWQKQEDILVGEKGWFYFKIFFKFDTSYGLLGNVLKDSGNRKFNAVNSAAKYLYMISGNKDEKNGRYKAENVRARLLLLQRFVKSLSYISSKAPWFFKKISNLQSFNVDFNDLSKEQFIEIECMEEAIDMRLGNLMDLYRTAAFDMYLQKEILPENLRKFDMSVMLFSLPVKYFQTSSISLTNGKFDFKNTYDNDMSKVMSFKLFTFVGCEFDLQSLNEYYAAEMNNESPFELGKSKIKIRYDRCYQHRMDEWNNILYGDNGVYFSANYRSDKSPEKSLSDSPNVTGEIANNALNDWKNRIAAIEYAIDNKYYFNRKSDIYKALIDASEGLIQNAMLAVDSGSILGNLYEQDYSKYSRTKDAINTVTSMFGKNNSQNISLAAIRSEIHDHITHGHVVGPYAKFDKEDESRQIQEMIDSVKGKTIHKNHPTYDGNKPNIVQNGRDPNRIGKRLDNVGQANATNNTNSNNSNNSIVGNSSNRIDANKIKTNRKKVKTVNEKIQQLQNK